MATPVFSLEIEGGARKTLTDWGLARPVRRRQSQARGIMTLEAPLQRVEDDPFIPFEAWCIVRRDEMIIFQGRRVLAPVEGRPDFEGISYQLVDSWYDLEGSTFQQDQQVFTGDPDHLESNFVSSVQLFTKFNPDTGGVVKQNNGQQITECLQWAIDHSAARLQIGTIEPAVNSVSYQVQDVNCGDAIRYCLRVSPDATTWFDYTTAPPTFHCRLRKNLARVTLPYADEESHISTKLTPRPDLQVPSVALKFKRLNSVNGISWVDPMNAPPGLQLFPLDATGTERRALVQTIDLIGRQETDVFATLTVNPFTANASDFSTRKEWWVERHSQLNDGKLRAMIIEGATVYDPVTLAAIDTSVFKNVLKSGGGQVAPWMKLDDGTAVQAIEATVQTKISYQQWSAASGGQSLNTVAKTFTTQVTLTNAISGKYSATETAASPEEIPTGMAQSLYESLQTLQYEGTHEHQSPTGEIMDVIGMENVLAIGGGRPEWATMDATIQELEEEFETGITTITVGPAKHLDAGDLTQLFLINRFRTFYENPDIKATGKASGSTVTLGQQMPKQDTAHDIEELGKHTVFGNGIFGVGLVQSQGAGGPAGLPVFQMKVTDLGGTSVPQAGSLLMDLSTVLGEDIKFRQWIVCVGSPPVMMKAWFLSGAAKPL